MKVNRLVLLVVAIAVGLYGLIAAASLTAYLSAAAPTVVAAAAPLYPVIAMYATGGSGEVTVGITISADGKVLSVDGRTGHPLLQAAAITAARRWEFEPAGAGAGTRTATLTFVFHLAEGKRAGAETTEA